MTAFTPKSAKPDNVTDRGKVERIKLSGAGDSTEETEWVTVAAAEQSINAQTGTTYTLVAGDAGNLVTASNASAQTYTVPPNSSVAFAVGTVVDILQLGAGAVTIAAGSGVTLTTSPGASLVMAGQGAAVSLLKVATNTWSVVGDLVLSNPYVPTAQTVNAQTGTTYTLVAGDAGKLVTLSNASAITLTVPQDSDATIAVGTYVDLLQLGAGQVTVAAGTGATLRTSGLTAKARAQYARFGVQKIAANTWSLFGDLAAA